MNDRAKVRRRRWDYFYTCRDCRAHDSGPRPKWKCPMCQGETSVYRRKVDW